MADQNLSDSPSLPPISTIPFQGPLPDQPAPSTPTEMAAASLSSSIESDLPISEVVTALRSASQTPAPILTEVKTETPAPSTPTVPASASPSVTTTVSVSPPPAAPKSPLYEDPDLVKVPGTQ